MPLEATLTDTDMFDLGARHTINVMDADGNEHDLRGADMTIGELATLEAGGTVQTKAEDGAVLRLTFERSETP